ncbi:MAG: hypothetical protein ABI181_14135 [Mycobacteriaceae bacterium]
MGLVDRLLGRTPAPPGWAATLAAGEEPLAVAEVSAGHLVATRLGLWVPEQDGPLRLGWHLISRAGWDGGVLELTVSQETGTSGSAVLLADVEVRRYAIVEPAGLPALVNERVTASVRSAHHRELPGGGAWFVQRSVPGHDGVVLQVRVDEGTDLDVVTDVAATVAAALPRPDAGESPV